MNQTLLQLLTYLHCSTTAGNLQYSIGKRGHLPFLKKIKMHECSMLFFVQNKLSYKCLITSHRT